MKREIIVPGDMWQALRSHLFDDDSREQLAFLLAGAARGWRWMRLLVREMIPVPPEGFDRQTGAYLSVKQAFTQKVLWRCHEEGLSLIEVHSHPFSYRHTTFSGLDLNNESRKFRYVARKISHIDHATVVVGRNDLDAHLWDRRRRRTVPVDRVRLLDAPIIDLLPTSSPKTGQETSALAPWLDRQVLAFGEQAQRQLGSQQVGVVGCGGTGSVVVQMLARLGVQRLTLVDPDIVEVTNLNRLVGATQSDVRRARPKVHVARRLVRRINPEARVQALPISLADPKALAALKGMDLIFGCTDNHGSRLILNQLAVQYLIPYIDLGAGLQEGNDGRLAAVGGQVRLVRPGAFCLSCIEGIDRVRAARDLMSPFERQRAADRGYIQGNNVPTPAVLFLNAEIAAHAIAEFLNLWTGYRSPTPLLYVDLLRSRLTATGAERDGSCVACGETSTFALGDLEELPGAGEGRMPDSVPVLAYESEADLTLPMSDRVAA